MGHFFPLPAEWEIVCDGCGPRQVTVGKIWAVRPGTIVFVAGSVSHAMNSAECEPGILQIME